jgi:hypothetical protein
MFIDGAFTCYVCQYAEWWTYPFLKGCGSSNEISLVSTKRCQTSHQQCHTFFSLWHLRGESAVKPVSYTAWGRIFMATNLTGLQPLWLFCLGVLEG